LDPRSVVRRRSRVNVRHGCIAVPDQPTENVGDGEDARIGCIRGARARNTGRTKTVEYLIHRFRALGLQPAGEHGGWTQLVPLIRNTAGVPTRLEVSVGGSILSLVAGRDISPRTIRPLSRVTIHDAPMVFVGYGVAAPERDWDDFKGFDLHGKVAVFLVNDPHFEAKPGEPAASKFGGPAMTYYGRWTYKFEEAARRGAIAALAIHETVAAGYDWKVASSTIVGSYDIVRSAGGAQPVLMQAWIARQSAVTLFMKAGLDFEALKRKARDPDFRPVELGGARFSIEMPVITQRVQSRNVLAKLAGTTHPDEVILFGAHWDAYGIGPPDAQGQTIRRGANDDALGIAGVLELARAFARGHGLNVPSSLRRGRPRRLTFSDQRRSRSTRCSRWKRWSLT
jgi:hypothetical protein